MKVRRYIDLIKGLDDSLENLIPILKQSGATEGEAVLALMVTRDLSMDEAQVHVTSSNLYLSSRQHKEPGAPAATKKGSASSTAFLMMMLALAPIYG